MNVAARGQRLLWMTWKILGTATVHLGARTVSADLVGRLDGLAIADPVPTLLTGDPGVVVPYEDVRDSELYRAWRRLDPAAHDPFAPSLTAELERAIGADAVAVLTRTAPLRTTIETTQAAIGKRSACSNFAMRTLPWSGLDATLEAKLATYAVPSGSCAPITTAEVARLAAATRALAAEPGLYAARLCANADHDRALAATLSSRSVCGGKPSWPAVEAAWPASWGAHTVSVDGLPAAPPVRWPRDTSGG